MFTKSIRAVLFSLLETVSADQPDVKSLNMEKMQLLEPGDGQKAIPVFQGLRTLTKKVNPTNTDECKHTLDIAEDKIRKTHSKPPTPCRNCETSFHLVRNPAFYSTGTPTFSLNTKYTPQGSPGHTQASPRNLSVGS